MLVMTYNVRNGGHENFQYERTDLILDLLVQNSADILALQEAMHFHLDGQSLLHRFENALGLRGTLAVTATGQHLILFVRKTALLREVHIDNTHFHHAMIRSKLELKDGTLLSVIATHLCPHGGLNRLCEAQYLANYARVHERVLLMGDLNSLSPHDRCEAALQHLPSHYRARHLLPDGSSVDTRAISFLDKAGFVDLHLKHCGDRTEATAPTRGFHPAEFHNMRVDYIFATPPVAKRLIRCSTVKSDLSEKASDHYPLLAEIDLDLA
jgi:exodeoxyribonuclease-3